VNQDQIWTAVQDELRFQLAKPSYETWLKNTTLLSADGSIYRVGVPSKLAKDWLEDRFAGLIQETLQAVTGTEVEVDFVVSSNGNRAALAGDDDLLVGEDNMPEPSPAVGQSELSEKFKFSSFVVGNNSRFAHAAAKAVADAPGETYNPLFLYGGGGPGENQPLRGLGPIERRNEPERHVDAGRHAG